MPASTSPLPPRAKPGLPVGFTAHRPSGAAMTVRAPFSTTTASHAFAKRRAVPSRSALMSAAEHPVSRAISPGWGVKIKSPLRMGQLPGLQQIGGGVQTVGVQHGAARKAGQERPRQHPGLGGAGCALDRVTEAGAQQQDRRLLALDAGDIFGGDAARRARFAGAEAALRQTGRHRRQHRFDAGQRDDARPGAQGPFHGQGRGAPVACAARHSQH